MINFHFSGKLSEELYQEFCKQIEEETRNFVRSEEGKKVIRKFVADLIKDEIKGVFGYNIRDDDRYKRIKEVVISKTLETMANLIS